MDKWEMEYYDVWTLKKPSTWYYFSYHFSVSHFKGKKKKNKQNIEKQRWFWEEEQSDKMAENISNEKQQDCESELTCFSAVFITCWLCDFGVHYLSFWISILHL